MAAQLLLGERPFSRNRNFEAFDDPRFKRAIALYRRLRALVRDLEKVKDDDGGRLVVVEEQRAGRPSVRLDLSGARAKRSAWLDRAAYDVLLKHPAAKSAVDALLERGPLEGDT
jgi:hypothetical protein